MYCIALTFEVEYFCDFCDSKWNHEKIFHEYLVTRGKNEEIFTTSRKFYHEIFILEQNLRNHESFLPQKFGAIRYTSVGHMILLCIT